MARLFYFDGRGSAEIVRLTLAAAGIPFDEELVTTREAFLKLIDEGTLLFGQIPVLDIDGRLIAQARAIVRYLGRKADLLGKNLEEEVLVDQYFEGARDFFSPMFSIGFKPDQDVLDGPVKKSMAKYLPVFEKVAASNGTGFLVGASLTISDIALLEGLLVCVEYLGIEALADYPALQKFYKVVTSVNRIASYLAGPQRKRKNDERYIREVCASLLMELPTHIANKEK